MSEENNLEMFEGEPLAIRERTKEAEVEIPLKIKEADRRQITMRTVDVEKLVAADDSVRGIWDFVCSLDLSHYYKGIESKQGEAGRSAWDPRVLVSLWLLGFSQGVSSARGISELCEYHPAYQWLTGMEVINYHTISDFRNRAEGIDTIYAEMLGVLTFQGLISLQRAGQDGTKIEANASSSSFRRESTLQEHLKEAQRHLQELSDNDHQQETSSRTESARRRAAQERVQKVEAAVNSLRQMRSQKNYSKKEEPRASETDPDARWMKQANGGFAPCYNAQLTTDAQTGMIVAASVSQAGNDREQLAPAMELVNENLGKHPEEVLVDSDYISRETILEMAESQTTIISSVVDRKGVSVSQYEKRGVAAGFYADRFSYNKDQDTFTCPAEKTLVFDNKQTLPGITYFYYKARSQDCRSCPFKQQCSPKTDARSVSRREEDPIVQEFNARMQTPEMKEIYKKRAQLCEFPHAWIKDKFGMRQFRLRGLTKVTIELLWAVVAYNLQQWIRIWWRPQLAAV